MSRRALAGNKLACALVGRIIFRLAAQFKTTFLCALSKDEKFACWTIFPAAEHDDDTMHQKHNSVMNIIQAHKFRRKNFIYDNAKVSDNILLFCSAMTISLVKFVFQRTFFGL